MNQRACFTLEVVETILAFCCPSVSSNLAYSCVQFSELLSCQAGLVSCLSSWLIKLPKAKSIYALDGAGCRVHSWCLIESVSKYFLNTYFDPQVGGRHWGFKEQEVVPPSSPSPVQAKPPLGAAPALGGAGARMGRTSSTKAGRCIAPARQGQVRQGKSAGRRSEYSCVDTWWQELLHSPGGSPSPQGRDPPEAQAG